MEHEDWPRRSTRINQNAARGLTKTTLAGIKRRRMKKKTVRQQKEKESGSAGSNFGSAAIKGNHLKLPALCEASLNSLCCEASFHTVSRAFTLESELFQLRRELSHYDMKSCSVSLDSGGDYNSCDPHVQEICECTLRQWKPQTKGLSKSSAVNGRGASTRTQKRRHSSKIKATI